GGLFRGGLLHWRALCGTLRALDREELDRTLERDVVDAVSPGNRRVRLTVGNVRTEASVAYPHGLSAHRVGVEFLECRGRAARPVLRLREQLFRALQVDREDRFLTAEGARVAPLLEVRTVAPVLRRNLGPALRIDANDARQV